MPATLTDPRTGQTLALVTRRILAPGIHTAPGFGVALYGPVGTPIRAIGDAARVIARFFVTPLKTYPMLAETVTIPQLRCRGGGVSVTAGHPPRVVDQKLADSSGFVPIPWPEGTAGHADGDSL